MPTGKCEKCGNEPVRIEIYGDIKDIKNAPSLCDNCVNEIVVEMSKSDRIRDVKRFDTFKEKLQELVFTKATFSHELWKKIEKLFKELFGDINQTPVSRTDEVDHED